MYPQYVQCELCGAELPVEAMMIEIADGYLYWACGGIIPETGEDAITACETRRGI